MLGAHKQNIQRLFSAVGSAAGKLYGGIKVGGSKALNTIKSLGKDLYVAIGGISNKQTSRKQNHALSKAMDNTTREVKKLPNNANLADVKEKLSKHFVKLQNDYTKIAPEKYKKVFEKWKEKKNASIDEMSIKELYKEVFKLRKGIDAQQKIRKKTYKIEPKNSNKLLLLKKIKA